MKVILVDDEMSTLLIIKKMISKIQDIEIVGSFQSPSEAYFFLKKNKVDMAFVDINMAEENGLDFAKRVTSEVKDIAISFLTAHKEHALEAFGIHAFDYMIKPISQSELENSILLAKQRFVFLQPKEHINPPKLYINCLGSVDVRSADNEFVRFTSTKSTELLAYLLMKKGRFVSKWSIAEDVFRGMPPYNAETYLNTTIYNLRKALEPHGMRYVIISGDEGYRIDMKDIYVDFIDFENRITSLMNINNYNQEEAFKVEKIFGGELFGDKDYHWSLSDKERLSEKYMSFSKKMIRYLLESNLLTGALHLAKKLVNIDEFDEEANCLIMEIYAARRNRVLLERQYQRYSKVLAKDLGLVPGNIVVKLYTTLIKSFE